MQGISKKLYGIFIVLIFFSCAKPVPEFKKVAERYPNGAVRLIEYNTLNEAGDTILLRSESFYETGQTYIKGSFDENGERNGYWVSYRDDGKIWSEGEFLNGINHGLTRAFHENGKLYMEGSYKNGHKDGYWRFYTPTGELEKEIKFTAPE